jgi:hypothetical protein
MSNEVAVKQSHVPATEMMNEWGAPMVSSQDVIIPKILPMQGLSVAVTQRKAQIGQFRDSVNNNLIGDIDQPFHAIPFYMEKMWDILLQDASGQFKWTRSVPVVENPASPDYNDNWKWEAEENGVKRKNIRRFNFYLLLPSEVESGASIPYVFSFKSTSIKEGKKLFTSMYVRNMKAGLPPAAYTIKIGGVMQTNEKGSFVIPNYTLDRRATDKELAECLSWIRTIKGGQVRVDNSDEDHAEASVSGDDTGAF